MDNEITAAGGYRGPASRMLALENEYIAAMESLGGDEAGRAAAQDYLLHSTAIYKGEVIRIGYIPKLFDAPMLAYMDFVQRTTYGILEKVMARFAEDADYRALFKFEPELERLILLPSGYDCAIPIGRFDLFLDEETLEFKFCEFNTDGSSAMNEDREAADSLAITPSFAKMSEAHELHRQELFDGWVDEFIRIYEGYDLRIDDPAMAIVDFNHSASHTEFDEFVRRFEERGMRTSIAWMDELVYRGEGEAADGGPAGLYTRDGRHIDIVYRRAVTAEIMDAMEGRGATPEETEGARALVRAFERREVCMIGAFSTHIAHCKQIYQVLWHPMTAAILTADELEFVHAHVPQTTFLVPEEVDIERVIAEKDSWIIKPSDRYGSANVYAGMDFDAAEWERHVRESVGEDYIVQEYCRQYPTPNFKPAPAGEPLAPWNNLIGYYNYGGKLGGLFNRAGQAGIIVGYMGGITVPTFIVDCDQSELGLGCLLSR